MDGATPALLEDDNDEKLDGAIIPPRSFRLIDAERIASQRLEGATDGSLKEALATTIIADNDTECATGAAPSLETRREDIGQGGAFAGLTPFQAAPAAGFGWMDAVPPAHCVPLFEAPDPLEVEDIASLMPPPMALSCAALAQQTLPTLPVPVVDCEALEVYGPPAPEAQASAPALEADAAGDALPDAVHLVAEAPEPPEASMIHHATVNVAAPATHAPPSFLSALVDEPKLEPIATAFAASARLAADATAASQALQHLKKMLAEQLDADNLQAEDFARLGAGGATHGAPRRDEADETPREGEVHIVARGVGTQAGPPPIPSVQPVFIPRTQLPLDPPPEALPQIMSRARVLRQEPQQPRQTPAALEPVPLRPVRTSGRKAVSKSQREAEERGTPLRTLPVPVTSTHDRQLMSFDVRGFCAGFVLSGAIGLVLYFVMTAAG